MTSSGSDPRVVEAPGGQGRPFGSGAGQAGGSPARGAAGGTPGAGTEATGTTQRRRRPPVWVLVLAALLVVGAAVAGVLLLGGRGAEVATPEAETVTLPVPTTTVEPAPYDAPTAFAAAMPATVRAHALSEAVEHVPLLTAGAIEGYRLVYTDGTTPVTLLAGQWETPEEASAAYAAMVAAQTAAVAAAGGDAGEATEVQEGPVTTADGTETGRYTLVPRADGTGTLTWWNGTAVLQLEGPAAALPDLFAAFPI